MVKEDTPSHCDICRKCVCPSCETELCDVTTFRCEYCKDVSCALKHTSSDTLKNATTSFRVLGKAMIGRYVQFAQEDDSGSTAWRYGTLLVSCIDLRRVLNNCAICQNTVGTEA